MAVVIGARVRSWSRELPPWAPALAVYLSVWLSAIASGLNRVGSLIGLGCFSLYGLAFLVARRWSKPVGELMRWAGGFVMVAVYAQHIATRGRPWNPNIMATLLLLTVPFGYVNGWMWFWWGGFALAFTGSRGGAVAAVLAIFTLLNFYIECGRLRSRLRWYYVAPGLLAAGVGVLLLVLWKRPNNVLNIRLPALIAAARAFWSHPVLGSGPWSHRVDCLPVTVAVEYGLVGLFAWAVLAVAAVRQVLTTRGNPARLAFTAWGFHQLFDNTLWNIESSIIAAAVLALLFGGEHEKGDGSRTEGGSSGAPRILGELPKRSFRAGTHGGGER